MKARRGFTLIELLVSISIISVLIGILLPSLQSGREKSRRVVCQSQLRQINTAIWSYSVAQDGRVPWIVSPMTNGGGAAPVPPSGEPPPSGFENWIGSFVPGFGQPNAVDADIDPFDEVKWPRSLAVVLMASEIGSETKIFACPSARVGWPKTGGPPRFTYRDAAVNQISGSLSIEGSYFRENFGFLDGRKLDVTPIHFTGNPLEDSQLFAKVSSTHVRDMVERRGNQIVGPHEGGVNVITRNFEIEFRDQAKATEELGSTPAGGVRF